jgi:hypothetical protein
VGSEFDSRVSPARLDFETQANTTGGQPSSNGPFGRPFFQHSVGHLHVPMPSFQHDNPPYFFESPTNTTGHPSGRGPAAGPFFQHSLGHSYSQMPSFEPEIPFLQHSLAPQSSNNGYASAPFQHPFASSHFQHAGYSNGHASFPQPFHSHGHDFNERHYAPPAETVSNYFKVHSWVKCWNDRKGAVSDKKGSKGKGPKSENISVIQSVEKQFKYPGNCQLSVLYGKECLAMEQQSLSRKTPLICRKCKVFLHKECGPVYHAFFCKDRVDLQEWHAVKCLR